MTWKEVLLTSWGIDQNESPFRRAAYLIHGSLVEKKSRVDIDKFWPLPFSGSGKKGGINQSLMQRLAEAKAKEGQQLK